MYLLLAPVQSPPSNVPQSNVPPSNVPPSKCAAVVVPPLRRPQNVRHLKIGTLDGGTSKPAQVRSVWTALLRYPASVIILNHMVQYSPALDASFAALADPTRRGVLERLGQADASITELAETFRMTLTGMKKHVAVLEAAKLVTTEKIGRVRTCRLGPRRLEDETAWITAYQHMLEARLNRLGAFLERTKGTL
jgi:DNA-binding transcriptional ArsR family regulator